MPATVPPSLVFVLALIACLASVGVAWWNVRLARRLTAALRARAEAESALERERAEHARTQASTQAALAGERELIELKSRFVSLVSHEFRTPLGIIMSAVELLKNYRERLTPEKQRDLVEDILASTRRMSGLMEQVLLLGRFEAGKAAARPITLDLADFLARLCDEQRSALGNRCPITITADGDLAGARADTGLLRHILANLVSNAVKYSPPGAEVEVSVRRDGEEAVFEIRDRGIGIPEADQVRLFEAFHRASNVGETPGSGLGLLIVKRCLDLHGGSIRVQSRAGEGTTFLVVLPLFAADHPPADDADLAPRSMASRIVA